jgi:stage II sporulation protein P
VLILHTHTTESYTRAGENYVETSDYRTLNEDYNMLSIGARVAEILEENGITVVHDRTLHDYPSYNGSYNHARKSMQTYLRQYPGIRLVLDLHRDATDGESGQLRTLSTIGGKTAAQLMLVMGTDEAGLTHDNWQQNLALALKLQAQLERQAPGITRPTILRAQRFNQDLSTGALLVEVGAAGNTHHEAMLAAEELAKAIVALSKGTQ